MVSNIEKNILKEKRIKKIYFEDKGQDFLEWTLDKNSVVIKSMPFQTSVWAGTKIIPISIKIGYCPIVVLKQDYFPDKKISKLLEDARELNYKVIKIKK